MEFWASAEVFRPAFAALVKCGRLLEDHLNKALPKSSLATLKGKFRYVPIVMPPEMAVNYPARSKLRKKEGDGVYDCSPQLDYETFVEGSFEQQMEEYTRGILMEAARIAGLGASPDQIKAFEDLVTAARFLTTGADAAAQGAGPVAAEDPMPPGLVPDFGDFSLEALRGGLQTWREGLLSVRASGKAKAPVEFIDHVLGKLDEALQVLEDSGDEEAVCRVIKEIEIPGLLRSAD